MAKFIDLTGRRFGRLVVIKFDHKNEGGYLHWLCICDCGKEKIVYGYHLKSGATKSCGCLQKEMSSAANKKTNIICNMVIAQEQKFLELM